MKTQIDAKDDRQEVFIQRQFNAPRELVFETFSNPELIIQWMGPAPLTTEVVKLDHCSHGSWRFIHRDPEGTVHGFHGVIHEVCIPERIIRTFEYENLPERGHVSLETINFEDLPGERSQVLIQSVYRSVEDRDAHMSSGLEHGIQRSHDQLDQLLQRLVLGSAQ